MNPDPPITTTATDADEHASAVRRVLWVTMVLNVAVAAAKLGYGHWAGIVSLQASGFDSVFDAMSNVIGLVAMGLARLPPDPEHPYGHRKIEVAVSLFIGLMVTLGFVEVGRGIWAAATDAHTPTIAPAAYAVMGASLVVNLGVSLYERHAAKRYNSMLLKADSAHTFADSIAGVAVLGGMYLVDVGLVVGDVLAAGAVMIFIGVTAYRVLRDGLDVLVDTSFLDPEDVRQVVEDIPEVITCHYVRSRGMPGHVHVDLHLSLDPDMKLEQAGAILRRVQTRIDGHFQDVGDVIVQLEPHKPVYVEDVPDKLV